MKLVTVAVSMIFALSATGSIYAQGRGNGQAKKTTVSAPTTAHGKKPETPKHTTTKTEARTAKAETKAAKTAGKAETRAAKAETKAARKSGTTTTTTTTTTTPTTDVTPTTTTTHTVKNPKLEARLLTLLPGVTDINAASAGFKNWGQFVAAAHVSNNLGIPFADLKARMTGIAPGATVPTTAPMSLGQAIQSWKGTTSGTQTLSSTQINTEVKKAEDAATADLRRSRDRS